MVMKNIGCQLTQLCTVGFKRKCAHIMGHNDGGKFSGKALDECRELCCADPMCKSFDHRLIDKEMDGGNCAISYKTKDDVRNDYHTDSGNSCTESSWSYTEINQSSVTTTELTTEITSEDSTTAMSTTMTTHTSTESVTSAYCTDANYLELGVCYRGYTLHIYTNISLTGERCSCICYSDPDCQIWVFRGKLFILSLHNIFLKSNCIL